MVLASMLFVALDTTAKFLTTRLPVEQVVWARFAFHFLLVGLLLAPRGLPALKSTRPGLQLSRSFFMFGANVCFFFAIKSMALVDASAIVFSGPLFVTALSVPLLGEHVGMRRWVAVFVGFVGALVVIRPGADIFTSVAMLPLLAAMSFAFYQIFTRKLATYDSPMTTLLYTSVFGTVCTSLYIPFKWVAPDALGWALMLLAGLFGACGQLALINAIRLAPVSTVAPFNYLGLLWASGLGFVFFGDLPDRYTLFGAAIVAGSGLYILHRERLRGS
jgi:drug/metabolite transporter (DMT)-like permease